MVGRNPSGPQTTSWHRLRLPDISTGDVCPRSESIVLSCNEDKTAYRTGRCIIPRFNAFKHWDRKSKVYITGQDCGV